MLKCQEQNEKFSKKFYFFTYVSGKKLSLMLSYQTNFQS